MLRCGVVGCGTVGSLRGEALLATGRCELVGVYDADKEAAGCLAQRLASRVLSYDDLCKQATDLICVCAPASSHQELIVGAAGHTRTVFCESPLAPTLAEGLELVEACREHGTRLFVSSYRAIPAFRTMKRACVEGEIGEPQMFRIRICDVQPGRRGDYGDADVPMLVVLAPPTLDYVAWLLGDVERVFAQASAGSPGVVLATARCQGGRLAHLEFNWAQPPSATPYIAMEVAGDRGVLAFDSRRDVAVDVVSPNGETGLRAPYARWPVHSADALLEEVTALACALEGKATPLLPTTEEIIQSLRAAEALRQSLETNRPGQV